MKYKKSLSSTFLSAILIAGMGTSSLANAVVYQAENYNAFYDTTPGNAGGVFRGDAVDIEGTSDSGGGYNVGWIVQGEWLAFNGINIPSTGSYTIRLRVASPNGATASVDLNAGSIPLGNFVIPATGGWQNWTTVSRTVNLNAGTYNGVSLRRHRIGILTGLKSHPTIPTRGARWYLPMSSTTSIPLTGHLKPVAVVGAIMSGSFTPPGKMRLFKMMHRRAAMYWLLKRAAIILPITIVGMAAVNTHLLA